MKENTFDVRRDMTIDKIIEYSLERDYVTQDDRVKRVFRCFFEWYLDGSYKKTKERICKLEMRYNY